MLSRPHPSLPTSFSAKRFARFVLFAALPLGLGACDFRILPPCAEYFSERPELLSDFSLTGNGLARRPGEAIAWARCPAGMRFTDQQTCAGTPVTLSFDQAQRYAEDMADKSAQAIRLPSRREMKSLTERSCLNPALNTKVFPAAASEKIWSGSEHWLRSDLACSSYSYKGQSTCNEAKTTALPFFLVIEQELFASGS